MNTSGGAGSKPQVYSFAQLIQNSEGQHMNSQLSESMNRTFPYFFPPPSVNKQLLSIVMIVKSVK